MSGKRSAGIEEKKRRGGRAVVLGATALKAKKSPMRVKGLERNYGAKGGGGRGD